ncbi:MMS19 nucleotide excision repair protein homolog [Dendronephthya gigantea]|uniref:MMS19 nucleotide excision repair protein homolog n=1 Tax=Dendronephthya gigantea TaxID=151771 RepID=UPI00106C13DE|nr:MMS19 nucleotide excision repair protein homolog [Dendronephthya gigantea]
MAAGTTRMEVQDLAAGLIENYMKAELEDERTQKINNINKAIIANDLSLVDIVEKLGPYLTNPDAGERCKGTELLQFILHRLLSFKLNEKEVAVLVEFFCVRMKDHFSIIPHVVSGLLALVSYQELPEDLTIKIVKEIGTGIRIQSLLQADRHNVFTLFSVLLNKKMAELQKLGGDFVFCFIQSMDGEKDPRNLLLCFNLVQVIVKNFPITLFAEDLFEVTSCYFPIDFTPPPNDPSAISREQLILALRNCLASTSVFAPFCLPLLVEKLSSDVIYAKRDALLTLATCANAYDSRFIFEYSNTLWDHIKKEIFASSDHSIEMACIEAIKSVVRNLSTAEEQNQNGALKEILTTLLNDCKSHLLQPDHKLMRTSASLLQNVSMASDMSCAEITDKVFPILLKQFECEKQINNQKAILDALLGFLQVAKDFQGRDSARILENYKESLLAFHAL